MPEAGIHFISTVKIGQKDLTGYLYYVTYQELNKALMMYNLLIYQILVPLKI